MVINKHTYANRHGLITFPHLSLKKTIQFFDYFFVFTNDKLLVIKNIP